MKKKVLLFLSITILGIGAYLFLRKDNIYLKTLQRFVPDNTLLLLETNELSNYPKSDVFSQVPLLSRVENQFNLFAEIGFSREEIKGFLKGKTLYFALLPEAKEDLNYITYLPINQADSVLIRKITALQYNISGNRIIYHTTRGHKIAEVIGSSSKSVLSFIVQDNIIIFSSSSILIEEAILPNKNTWIDNISSNLTLNNDVAVTATHLNKEAIKRFISKVSLDKNKVTSQFTDLLSGRFANFKISEQGIFAEGNDISETFFEGQQPNLIKQLSMIPNSSSFIIHVPVNDPILLEENCKKIIKKNKELNTLRNTVKTAFKLDFSTIYKSIENEILMAGFDEASEEFNGKVLILRGKGLLPILKNTAKEVAKEKNANVVSLEYGGYSIQSLGIREFPSMVFGENFVDFEESYFTEYKDYLVITNSLSAMKSYLLSLSKGDVWSNSSKNQSIVKKCKPSNLTLISETNRALLGFNKTLTNTWSNKFAENQNVLNRIQMCVFQVNGNKSLLSLFKNTSLSGSTKRYTNKWIKLSSINIDSASKPFYFINPYTKKQETFIQGEDNQIYYIKGTQKIWSYQLAGKLVGEIKYIKILPNTQQQLLLATSNKIYILTKNQAGFDVKTITNASGTRINDFIIFDNEADKKQKITIFSANGASFKIDRTTLELQLKYKPNAGTQYILPISTVIFKGIEYAILLDKKGKLTLQDANGGIASGFPIALNRVFQSTAFLEGIDEKIVIKVLSENGELFSVNLSGKIIEKKQLLRTNIESKFFLCADQRNSDWVIMRSDGKDVVVIDKNEQEIFTIKEEIFGVKRLKYYNLGVGGKYFALTNTYTNYRFFDETGTFIGGIPIISSFPPIPTYSESYQKLIIDITTPTTLENWSVKLR